MTINIRPDLGGVRWFVLVDDVQETGTCSSLAAAKVWLESQPSWTAGTKWDDSDPSSSRATSAAGVRFEARRELDGGVTLT